MDADLAATRFFQNNEAYKKYAPFFHNQTQLDNFLRIPVSDRQRDDLLYNLQREVQQERNTEALSQIAGVFDDIQEEDGEPEEFRLPTPASSPTST